MSLMSIWTRITAALGALAKGEGLSAVFEKLRSPPEKSVGFTIAVIALSAKMAKADGNVTRAEVVAFREVFYIPAAEESSAAKVFNLARQDVAGFETYARQIKSMFGARMDILEDLLEGLFHIATVDGAYHVQEDAFLTPGCRYFWPFSTVLSRDQRPLCQGSDRRPFRCFGRLNLKQALKRYAPHGGHS